MHLLCEFRGRRGFGDGYRPVNNLKPPYRMRTKGLRPIRGSQDEAEVDRSLNAPLTTSGYVVRRSLQKPCIETSELQQGGDSLLGACCLCCYCILCCLLLGKLETKKAPESRRNRFQQKSRKRTVTIATQWQTATRKATQSLTTRAELRWFCHCFLR